MFIKARGGLEEVSDHKELLCSSWYVVIHFSQIDFPFFINLKVWLQGWMKSFGCAGLKTGPANEQVVNAFLIDAVSNRTFCLRSFLRVRCLVRFFFDNLSVFLRNGLTQLIPFQVTVQTHIASEGKCWHDTLPPLEQALLCSTSIRPLSTPHHPLQDDFLKWL